MTMALDCGLQAVLSRPKGRINSPPSPAAQPSTSRMQTAKNVLKSPRLAFKREKSPANTPSPALNSAGASPNLTVPEERHSFRFRNKSKSPSRNKADKSPSPRNRHKSEPSPTEQTRPVTKLPLSEEDVEFMNELGLTTQQIQEYREAFTLVDKDGDGRITTAELSNVMQFLKNSVSQEQVEVMINQADIDGNGTVEFDEFLKMMSRRKAPEEPKSLDDQMREFFKVFDRDGNGFIDAQELHYTMTNLGENISDADVKEMIREADLDGDGRINYEEFIKMMQIKQSANKA